VNIAAVRPDIGSLLQGTDDLQQLSVAYPTSPLNEDGFGLAHGLLHCDAPKPSERAPDAPVIAADSASTTLFQHIYNPDGRTFGWALLLFDGRQRDALVDLRHAAAAVQPWDWVRPRLVLGAAVAEAGDGRALSDLGGEAHATYGVGSSSALILVRPDGHIAFRGPADRGDALRAYCTKVFGSMDG
jgi:3-(3-hydroxy-phenyl)propionate hydroxylase